MSLFLWSSAVNTPSVLRPLDKLPIEMWCCLPQLWQFETLRHSENLCGPVPLHFLLLLFCHSQCHSMRIFLHHHLYYSLIYSHLSYCTVSWGHTYLTKLNCLLLLLLQKRVLRIITIRLARS